MRWLTGRMYGQDDLPRRLAWLLVFTAGYTLASWLRPWGPA